MAAAPPEAYTSTRLELQRVATHILARARFAAEGRFGLRVTLSGISTPAFGDDGQVLRILGTALVRELRTEHGARSAIIDISGHSLAELGAFAGVDLDEEFNAGTDTPAVGDPTTPIDLHGQADEVLRWFDIGARALDRVLPGTVEPSIVQLWPEHFDVAFDAETAHGRVNLGASPGDSGQLQPYLYVGPWGADRPGDASFWNAGFGATVTRDALYRTGDPLGEAVEFFGRGLSLLG
jgi:hypothetical protein